MICRTVHLVGGIALGSAVLVGCASLPNPFAKPDERWADYKNWTKITEGKPGTGDPTGFIGNVHKGPEGYRDVYVNDAGLATITGSAPYNFPAGTIVVKEQFASQDDWEAGKGAAITVSVKQTGGETLAKDNWLWADSYTSSAEESTFCSGCHSIAAATDYVFTNGDFLAGIE